MLALQNSKQKFASHMNVREAHGKKNTSLRIVPTTNSKAANQYERKSNISKSCVLLLIGLRYY